MASTYILVGTGEVLSGVLAKRLRPGGYMVVGAHQPDSDVVS